MLQLKKEVCIFFIKKTPRLQENPSARKREHPAFQNMKFLYFILFLWITYALLDPDPDPATQINADPDPKPWLILKDMDVWM
jgi:hypothetical protein